MMKSFMPWLIALSLCVGPVSATAYAEGYFRSARDVLKEHLAQCGIRQGFDGDRIAVVGAHEYSVKGDSSDDGSTFEYKEEYDFPDSDAGDAFMKRFKNVWKSDLARRYARAAAERTWNVNVEAETVEEGGARSPVCKMKRTVRLSPVRRIDFDDEKRVREMSVKGMDAMSGVQARWFVCAVKESGREGRD